MGRKVCCVSLRKRVSRPRIIRKRSDGLISSKKEAATSLNKRRSVIMNGVNKSTKKKARKKMQRRQDDNSKLASGGDALTNIGGCLRRRPTPLKIAGNKRRVAFHKMRNMDSGVGDAETVGEVGLVHDLAESAVSVGVQEQCVDEEHASGAVIATNDFPKSWTEEMIRYYFEPSEKRKNFDCAKIMENIEYKASDWWISDADRTDNRRKRDFFQRCAKCNRKGHIKKDCKKHAVCYVCGEFNHDYSQCPNAVCLTCGRATKKYSNNCRQCRKMLSSSKICTLCGQLWHEETLCPSKWRKYSMEARSACDSTIRLNARKCCYNCAQRGHFGFECPLASHSDYPPENPLKTAFPLQQRYYVSGEDGNLDQAKETRVFGSDNADPPCVHVIFLASQTSDVLCSELGKHFLTNLSRNTNIRIELFRGKRSYVKLFGDLEIVEYCKRQLLEWQTSVIKH